MKAILPLLIPMLMIIASCESKQLDKTTDKPNIILILADDLGYGEVGVYGQTKIETPYIDALASDGMMFTQFYTAAPVCAPARAALLTGQHLGHTYVRGNDEWRSRGDVWNFKAALRDSTLEGQRPLPENTVTIAQVLQEQGYKTGMIGKWGLGAPHTHSIPTKMGFDYFFGYNCQRQAHTYTTTHLYENERKSHLQNDTLIPGTGIALGADSLADASYSKYEGTYSETVSVEKMMDWVDENKEVPFFLYWASPIPHLPLQAPKRWVEYYHQKFGDEDPYVFYEDERGAYFPTRYPRATYAAMISYLDENIGRLIEYLKKEGLYDNTMIVFTSDNGPSYTGGTDSPWFDSGGPFNSEYGRGKGFLHEGGIRVPLIVSWPEKVEKGAVSDHIGAFWDFFPTFNEIAGVMDANVTDGISILPTLTNKGVQEKADFLYWEFPEYGGQAAVRKGDFKMLWKDIKKGNDQIEIYNLIDDPAEKSDLSDEHPEMIAEFQNIICREHTTPKVDRFLLPALEKLCNDAK